MSFTRTPERALRLTDRAPLEFFELETLTRKASLRRKLAFVAPKAFDDSATLILPQSNVVAGVLTNDGAGNLTWESGGGTTPHDIEGAMHTAAGLTAGHVLRATSPTTFAFQAIQDGDIPSSIARDTEVTAAVAAHVALSDPHTQYQKESEKDAANGYASLDAGTLVPAAELGTGTPTSAKFLDGSRAWRVLAATDLGTNTPTSAKFLDGSQAWRALTIDDIPGSGDISYHRQVGTGTIECWYPAGVVATANGALGSTTGASAGNLIHALPFYTGRGGTLDRLGVDWISGTTANHRLRLGIYATTSDTDLYPGSLIVDGGEMLGTGGTGVRSVTISQALSPNKLVWIVAHSPVTSSPTYRLLGGHNCPAIFGWPSTFGNSAARSWLTVTQTYGALPSSFPAVGGATFFSNPGATFPVIMCRYSA